MTDPIAALSMYDWPENRAETDALWARMRQAFRAGGIDAPAGITRRNGDVPAIPGGIRDKAGRIIAPDPSTLPPNEMNYHFLWLHPALLFAQTCWGPMELGLSGRVKLIGQPSYDGMEGGRGEMYSSAIVVHAGTARPVAAPVDGRAILPLDLMRGKRFTYNGPESMSGILALTRDLAAVGESLDIFSERSESGGHRSSIIAIADGRADVATIDSKSWAMAQRFEPAARDVVVVGWTALRKGLPYITALTTPDATVRAMREALAEIGAIVAPVPA